MNDIMLDIETLDNRPTAVVVSIGAVFFDPYTKAMGNTFYAEMAGDIDTQIAAGRTVCGPTIRWWMQQSADARDVFSGSGASHLTTPEALVHFARFVESAQHLPSLNIWGNGAAFDNTILASLYDSMCIKRPWSYRNDRCYRTVAGLGYGPRPKKSKTPHNALSDAVSQAVHLQEVFAAMESCHGR